jgi:hypothetical protein
MARFPLSMRRGVAHNAGVKALGTGTFERVNDDFHRAYDAARGDAEVDAPVLVLLEDVLIVFRGSDRRDHPITPPVFHVIKSVAHAPIALYAALYRAGEHPFDRATERCLRSLEDNVVRALASLDDDVGDGALRVELRELLERSLAFAEHALENGHVAGEALERFAREAGPRLARLIDHATRVQLAALHDGVEEVLASMSEAERRGLHVVVAGDHQARARSYGVQYFRKRLGETDGVEDRVVYGEGVEDADEALALVGRRRLDRAVAKAFFGDAKRLQRDVLGDAAARRLDALDLAPIR